MFSDTQGFADTNGRDARFVQDLATTMMRNITSVNVFLLLFKGNENRFNKWTQDQLSIYESIFGPEFWKHAMTEFTFWSHSGRDNWKREKACKMYV